VSVLSVYVRLCLCDITSCCTIVKVCNKFGDVRMISNVTHVKLNPLNECMKVTAFVCTA